MKNTKHTEINDPSNQQDVTSHSKRKILTSIGVTSGVLGASALSQNWVKPVVNSVVLPAHAEHSPTHTEPPTVTTAGPTTMAPGTAGPTTMAPTTMAPTTMAPTQPAIILRPDSVTVREGSTTSTPIDVVLATEPQGGPVTVVVTEGDVAKVVKDGKRSLIFSTTNWNQAQTVELTVGAGSVAANTTDTVTFTASGGGYDAVTPSTLAVAVTNDDTMGDVRLSTTAIEVNESATVEGTSPTGKKISVSLTVQPEKDKDVVVELSAKPNIITYSKKTLTFTSVNYAKAQDVIIGATAVEVDTKVTVSFNPSSESVAYKGSPDAKLIVMVKEASNNPPTDVTATSPGGGQLTVSWKAPKTAAVVTRYLVEIEGVSAGITSIQKSVNTTATSHSFTGLKAGTYSSKVSAYYAGATAGAADVLGVKAVKAKDTYVGPVVIGQ